MGRAGRGWVRTSAAESRCEDNVLVHLPWTRVSFLFPWAAEPSCQPASGGPGLRVYMSDHMVTSSSSWATRRVTSSAVRLPHRCEMWQVQGRSKAGGSLGYGSLAPSLAGCGGAVLRLATQEANSKSASAVIISVQEVLHKSAGFARRRGRAAWGCSCLCPRDFCRALCCRTSSLCWPRGRLFAGSVQGAAVRLSSSVGYG